MSQVALNQKLYLRIEILRRVYFTKLILWCQFHFIKPVVGYEGLSIKQSVWLDLPSRILTASNSGLCWFLTPNVFTHTGLCKGVLTKGLPLLWMCIILTKYSTKDIICNSVCEIHLWLFIHVSPFISLRINVISYKRFNNINDTP